MVLDNLPSLSISFCNFEALHFLCVLSASKCPFMASLYPYSHPHQLCTRNSHSLWFYHYPLNFSLYMLCFRDSIYSIAVKHQLPFKSSKSLYQAATFHLLASSPSASQTKIFISSPKSSYSPLSYLNLLS